MKKLIISVISFSVLFISGSAFAETAKPGAMTGEFGNHCAMGLTMGKQVTTDCTINWKDPANDKTYCFSSEDMKTQWAKNTTSNEAKATAEYSKITTPHQG